MEQMKIAILHNFAEHPGGGDLVALDIIEALLEKDYTVSLYTFTPEGVEKVMQHFGKDPRTFESVVIKRVEVPRVIRHPYSIYFITKKVINELKKHDLVVFFDDIPKPAHELKRVLAYVHYPHASRIILNELVPYHYRYSLKGRTFWKLHSLLFKQCFFTDWSKSNIFTVVNSTLTQDHVMRALKPIHLTKIYPPVQVEQIVEYVKRANVAKEDLVVYIGRIQPEKGIDDVIRALALIKDASIRARVMGFLFDEKYLKNLISLARSLGVEKRVEIITNATRGMILESLARAKALVHPAHHEPFGIAVVEGMAAGCIPIVRRGFNGPWIDIVEQGRCGCGFSSTMELANTIRRVLYEKTHIINRLTSRALEFSEHAFKEKISYEFNFVTLTSLDEESL